MSRKPVFPMYVDLSEKKVVVIGGEGVAADRAAVLLAYAGEVKVIAPRAEKRILDHDREGRLTYLPRAYQREDIFGADLVVAASGDLQTDLDAAAACKCLGIIVNIAGAEEKGDFYFS